MTDALDEGRATSSRSFQRYPEYKDSRVEWLGRVPVHWKVKKLKFLAPIRTAKQDRRPADAVYVGLENVESWTGRLILESQPETVDSAVTAFKSGDVLFGKLRPYLAKAARPDFDGVCTSEIIPLKPTAECDQSFLMYCTLNEAYIRWLDSRTYGTKMPRVSPSQVGDSYCALPSVAEQRIIADFLDRETAAIDQLIAKKEQLIELLKEQRTSLITRAVTRGLDPDVPMRDSGLDWMDKIPSHWDVKKVTWLFAIGSGTTPRSEDPAYYGGEVPWVTTSELRESVVTATDKAVSSLALRDYSSLKVHPAGSVAVAMYGATIGRVGILGVPATVNQACCVFSELGEVNNWFWFYWLQMRRPYLVELGYGGGQPNLSQEVLRSLRVPLPPLDEQEQIAAYLESESSDLDALISEVRNAIDTLKEFRSALISAAVTGKIDVREQVS